jgi:hypothetical protein
MKPLKLNGQLFRPQYSAAVERLEKYLDSLEDDDMLNTNGLRINGFGSNTVGRAMVNRMAVSHYKYGKINGNGPAVDELKSGLQRAAMYDTRYLKSKKIWQGRTPKPLNTGNTENLIDAANFMLLEYMFPKHRDAEFEAQPSSASPGLAKAG